MGKNILEYKGYVVKVCYDAKRCLLYGKVDGIVDAIKASEAMKVYICNVMTESGETEGYTVSDHIRALFNHGCYGLFGLCMVNSAPLPRIIAQRYAKEGSAPVFCDEKADVAAPTQLMPGTLKIDASVEVTFKLN